MLNNRIKDLREADLAERALKGYQLTKRGQTLIELLRPFGEWSREWAQDVFHFTEYHPQ